MWLSSRRAAAFIRRPLTPSTHQTALREPDETEEGPQRGQVRASSHPWVGRGAPSGLIRPFELDRRKQSEESSIELRGPSRSQWSQQKLQLTGTAVRRRVREHNRASLSLFAGARRARSTLPRPVRQGELDLAHLRHSCGEGHEHGHRCAIAPRAGRKPQAIKTRSDPQGPPYGGRPSHADRFRIWSQIEIPLAAVGQQPCAGRRRKQSS